MPTEPTGRTPYEIREIPPEVLDCGCRTVEVQVRVGYGPHPGGVGRARSYRCAVHRVETWEEPDPI